MSNPSPAIILQNENSAEKKKLSNKNFENINNSKFIEMKDMLYDYYVEIEDGIRENKKIENENFKKHFFSSLENLLNQVSLIKNERIKSDRINDVFIWFNKRIQFFKDLNSITSRTAKNIYEKYPDLNSMKKSNYYQADNYPLFFESKHRTEDEGLLPPKDRLKEFKRKTLLNVSHKETNNKNFKQPHNITSLNITNFGGGNNSNNASTSFKIPNTAITNQKKKEVDIDMTIRVSSATSSNCFRSTHYTMNNSGTKFFNSQNLASNLNVNSSGNNIQSINNEQTINLHPTREIKSSYSTFRPRYDYTNLVIEKNNISAKQKELAEKRNQEEMKEFINEWGMNRARYVEEVEKKNEMKKILKFYEKNIQNFVNKNPNNEFHQLNSNVSNNSFLKNSKILSEENQLSPSPNKKKDENIGSNTKSDIKQNLTSAEKAHSVFFNDSDKKKINMIRIKEKTERDEFPTVSSFDKKPIFDKNNDKEKKINPSLLRNKTKNIKNIDKDNKIFLNKEEKKIDIKFKNCADNNKTINIIQQMKSQLEKIPTDKVIILKAHDKVFDTRHTYANLLNVKEIDNYKDGYKYHVTPLSLYDNLNVEHFDLNKNNEVEEKMQKRPSTGYEFLRSHYNKNTDSENFLKQRKNLTQFNSENTFKNEEKPRNLSINYERVKSAFIPPSDEIRYPKYYLPTPGFGLLQKPIDPNAKKKKRGKSSKKKKKK